MVGVRYYLYTDAVKPFLMANTGINTVSRRYIRDGDQVDKTTVQTHFQVGIGLAVKVVSGIEIEISGKYNSHLLEPSIPYNITGMEFGFGLNYLFD
jgi:hypothetical protein